MSTLRPGAFKVCVQSCQNGQISGQVVAYRLKSPMPFRDTGSLVLSIESVLDAQNFPQAFRRSRSFVPRAVQNPYASDTLNSGMSSLAVSSDAKFTLQTKSDGSLVVESSDAATKAAVQKFFDNTPALAKKFGQIQALSGLDDARKSLQVSPSDLRKRIEVESMAAWWSGSGNATNSFGSYSNSSLSMLSGLNLNV